MLMLTNGGEYATEKPCAQHLFAARRDRRRAVLFRKYPFKPMLRTEPFVSSVLIWR